MTITLTVTDEQDAEVLRIVSQPVTPASVYRTVNSPTPSPSMAIAALGRLFDAFDPLR
jgi:hypothetical protein